MAGLTLSPAEKDLFKIVLAIRQLMEGRSNAVGTVTLTAGAVTTTVTAPTCAVGSQVFLFPQTANAAGALATTYIRPADVTAGQFIVTHANAGTTDRTFSYEIRG